MRALIRAARAVGMGRLWTLHRAYRIGWHGMIQGYFTTRTLQVLFRCGFLDEVLNSGPVSPQVYAAARGFDVGILAALCSSLDALGLLERVDAGYLLTPKGRLIVEVGRGWFEGIHGYRDVYHNLEALLRKRKVYGQDVFRRTDEVSCGTGRISSWLFYPLVVDILRRSGYVQLLDLGCGDSSWLLYLCENSSLDGCGIDISEEALASARERVHGTGMADRVELHQGDMTKLDAVADRLPAFDVATAIFVLHELLHEGEQAVIAFLEDFQRLFPGVPLVVFEVILPTLEQVRKKPGMAAQYRLQHTLTHQRLVDREVWRDLFDRAGFRGIEEQHLRFARATMFTLRQASP